MNKDTLEYKKMKKKEYNKAYREKIKSIIKSTDSSKSQENSSDKDSFFFQNQKNPQQPIVLTVPEKTIGSQIKNQLLMGMVGLIPLVLQGLLTRLNTQQKSASPTPSTTPPQNLQPSQEIPQQYVSFL